MPGGGRWHYPVEMHTVSVGDPLDLRAVQISPTAVMLKPGESKRIEVTIERGPGLQGQRDAGAGLPALGSIYGNSLPPGVTIDDKASQTLLAGDQVKGHITLKAAADAKPVQDQLVPVMAHVSINFVMKFTYCGEPIRVTVAPAAPAKSSAPQAAPISTGSFLPLSVDAAGLVDGAVDVVGVVPLRAVAVVEHAVDGLLRRWPAAGP